MRNFSYNATLDLIAESISGIYTKELGWSYATSGMKGKALGMSVGGVNNYSYGYDTYGRINQVNDIDYAYLPNSNLLSQVNRPNNVNTTWSYEPNRNLVTEVANGNISTFGYTNNVIGNRTTMNRSGSAFGTPDTISYTYDNRAEVTTALSSVGSSYHYQYNYDPIGNRLTSAVGSSSINYASNELNQYTQVGTQNPTYDADGNMLTNDGWTYTWNGENRMVAASKGNQRLEFDYDYMGRRIFKKVYDGNTLTAHTRLVYDKYKLIQELNALSNNSLLRQYVWQPDTVGLDVPLSVFDATANQTYYYNTDANKNISDLIASNGTVVAHYEYTPFGSQTTATGSYTANPFRFSSEYFDLETELVYYNYRYYHTKLGRWLSQDPKEEKGGMNLYAIARNNSINFYDLLGLACCGGVEMQANECCHNNKIQKARGDIEGSGGQCCIKLTKICLTESSTSPHQNICIGSNCFSFGMSDDVPWYLNPFSRWFDSGEIYVPDGRGENIKCFYVKKSVGDSFLSSMKDSVGTRSPYQFTNIGTWGSNCRSFSQIYYNTFESSAYDGDLPPCPDSDNDDNSEDSSSSSSSSTPSFKSSSS